MADTHKSEVARLLENIRLSYESAYLALHGPAMTGKHEFITTKIENMQHDHERLQTLIGKQEAGRLFAETLDKPLESEAQEKLSHYD